MRLNLRLSFSSVPTSPAPVQSSRQPDWHLPWSYDWPTLPWVGSDHRRHQPPTQWDLPDCSEKHCLFHVRPALRTNTTPPVVSLSRARQCTSCCSLMPLMTPFKHLTVRVSSSEKKISFLSKRKFKIPQRILHSFQNLFCPALAMTVGVTFLCMKRKLDNAPLWAVVTGPCYPPRDTVVVKLSLKFVLFWHFPPLTVFSPPRTRRTIVLELWSMMGPHCNE